MTKDTREYKIYNIRSLVMTAETPPGEYGVAEVEHQNKVSFKNQAEGSEVKIIT